MPASTASPTPSPFGGVNVFFAGVPGKEVAQWSVHDFLAYLGFLALGHTKSIVSAQGMDGCMIVELVESDDDMQELGFSIVK